MTDRKLLLRNGVKIVGILSILSIIVCLLVLFADSGTVLPILIIACLGTIGWAVVLLLHLSYQRVNHLIYEHAESEELREKAPEVALRMLFDDFAHKERALELHLSEEPIEGGDELARILERLLNLLSTLLRTESAEIVLFERESGKVHSSFSIGKPFSRTAHELFQDSLKALEAALPGVYFEPITFAGETLGMIRIAFPRRKKVNKSIRKWLRLFALHGGVAILNSEYTAQLMRLKEVSEQTLKAKLGFLATLSHELRGPLGIMINAVDLVLDDLCGPLNTEQKETLGLVKGNGTHLLELMNDVLDYAKQESGKLSPQQVNIIADDILLDLIKVIRPQADGRKHTVIQSPSTADTIFSCDRRHARQILINLLTNAVKYTPEGGRIVVWAEKRPEGKIRINVQDSGIGITPQDRPKVFAPFERIDNEYTRSEVGTGIGLSLTKRLVEANGGTIDFESVSGKGSTFWVDFPPALSDETRTEAAIEREVVGNGRSILLLGRQDDERRMTSRYLDHLGFVTLPADSKDSAFQILRAKKTDLIIIQNELLSLQGEQLVREIRSYIENLQDAAPPVLLVSNRAFPHDIERSLRSGVDRYLVKPFHLKELGVLCDELAALDKEVRTVAATSPKGMGKIIPLEGESIVEE